MSLSSTHTLRRPLIVGCLTVALLLVAALGYEAVAAARAQRETAEGVLRDYAQLAADQFARNVSITLDYGWFYPVVTSLSSLEPGQPFPDPDLEIAVQQERVRIGDLVTGFFRFDLGTREGAPRSGEEAAPRTANDYFLEEEQVRALRGHERTEYDKDSPYAALLRRQEDGNRIFVYRRVVGPDGYATSIVGFEADAARLPGFMERALELYALLPESLTAGGRAGSDATISDDTDATASDNTAAEDLVWVRLVDSAGRTLFENGAPTDLLPAAQAEIGGRFGNLGVEAAIPRSSADLLVIGGAYGTRLPLIVGTLAITVVVMLVGVGLLRREQELVHLREQFIAGASHELRTPLAQLRMFTETLLLERVRSSEEHRRALVIVDREARRLAFLVENLLQFSSPRPQMSFLPAATDLGRLVAEVVESFEPLAAARGVCVEVRAPAGIEAFVDRDMLQQVLLNLLDNAVKYGPDNQTVTVELSGQAQAGANDATSRGDDERIVLSVSDQGPGVPEADRLRVWERFWRGRSTNGVTGTGIGLALVKEVVVLHGGDIRVEDAPGGGARFIVRLPRAAP